MKRENQCNVSEVIEKLLSEIEHINQESGNESQKGQVKMRKGDCCLSGTKMAQKASVETWVCLALVFSLTGKGFGDKDGAAW